MVCRLAEANNENLTNRVAVYTYNENRSFMSEEVVRSEPDESEDDIDSQEEEEQ